MPSPRAARRPLPPPLTLLLLLLPLAATVVTPRAARADRLPTAVLWMGGAGGSEAATAIDGALSRAATAAPAGDAEARRLLVEGGPRTKVRERLQQGKERFAALRDLDQADALLAEAEAIALGELPVGEACPHLVEIGRLRLRYAELTRDEARAAHAVTLLRPCLRAPTADDAAALSRHPPAAPRPASPLRVESEPPGATVFVDLVPIGTTPVELPSPRRPGALLDVERDGLRKVHRELSPEAAGTLALALSRDDGLARLVDRVRETDDARPADVAELARRLGAAQLLAVRAGREGRLEARLFDVARAAWTRPLLDLGASPLDEGALAGYLASGAAEVAAGAKPPAAADPAAPVPAWKRWYTWVIGGVLVGGVAAYVVASNIGDDQITIRVER